MEQVNMFETMYDPLPIWDKPLKVCELYGGIGSQLKAWRNLGLKIQEHHLVEVDIDATISYAAIHCQLNTWIDNFEENNRFPKKDIMVKELTPYGWWTNDKPKDISKLKLSKLKALWLSQTLTNNLGDVFNLKGIDMPKVDIITWSTPCQDFSLAGKQKGFDGKKGGLTFKTLQLFREMKEYGTLPNFLLFENVPNIVSKLFIHGFNVMRKELRDLGYDNLSLRMNAKNFGIPQTRDRVFILSIKKEYLDGFRYDEPVPMPLELRLKDMLQDNPEGKYNLSRMERLMITKDGNIKRYINSDVVDEFQEGDAADISFPNGYNKGNRVSKDIVPTLAPTTIKNIVVKDVDPKYYIDGEKYDGTLKQEKMDELVKSGVVKDGDVINHSYTNSNKNKNSRMNLKDYVESDDGIMPTITTRPDTLGIVIPVDEKYFISDRFLKYCTDKTDRNGFVRGDRFNPHDLEKSEHAFTITTNPGGRATDNFVIVPEATKKGFAIAEEGDGIYLNRPHQKRGVVQKDMVSTIKTNGDDLGVIVKGNYMPSGHTASRIVDGEGIAPLVRENHGTVTAVENKDLRIRKLTPRECWRLMGFDDEDFDNASRHTTDTQLYKQAGNSIVVNVLMEIFRNLLLGGKKDAKI